MDPMGMLVCFPGCSPFKMLFQLMVPRMGGGVFFPPKIFGLIPVFLFTCCYILFLFGG